MNLYSQEAHPLMSSVKSPSPHVLTDVLLLLITGGMICLETQFSLVGL